MFIKIYVLPFKSNIYILCFYIISDVFLSSLKRIVRHKYLSFYFSYFLVLLLKRSSNIVHVRFNQPHMATIPDRLITP